MTLKKACILGFKGSARVIATLGLLLLTFWAQPVRPLAAEEVTGFGKFYSLPPDQARAGAKVRIRGAVLCYDKGWNQLYVHDGQTTAWISPQLFASELEAGSEVEITGTTTLADGHPAFTNLSFRVVGKAAPPTPRPLSIGQMTNAFGEWVQIRGRVRVAETSLGRLALILQSTEGTCLVYVMGPVAATASMTNMVGAEVQVQGINASKISGNRLEKASLVAPGAAAIAIVQPAQEEDSQFTTIDHLLNRPLGPWTNDPVRLVGLVESSKPGESLALRDPTGLIRANVIQSTPVDTGSRVELHGYFTVAPAETFLRDAWFNVLPTQNAVAQRAPLPQAPPAGAMTLTNTAAVRGLSRDQAALGLPVNLAGTVIYADPEWRICFLQDSGGGVFVDLNDPNVRPGQWVEVAGRTSRGGFAPEVLEAAFRVIAETNFPTPIKADLRDLANGHLDAEWVELQGVVRRSSENSGRLNLEITTPKGKFKAVVLMPAGTNPPKLVDAVVSVRGAVTSEMNARGQLTGVILYVPGFSHLTVIESAPENISAIDPVKIASVATFDHARADGRRIKLRGTVTAIIPNEGFFIQDETGGIRVEAVPDDQISLGAVVEVLGFPALGSFTPHFEGATWVRAAPGVPPKAVETTADEILRQGIHDAQVVQIEASLLQKVPLSARPKLLLQSGSVICTAQVLGNSDSKELARIRPGSLLRIRGVCSIQSGERGTPESLRIYVAEPGAVTILQPAPWWTMQNTVVVGATILVAGLLSWIWIGALRREVRRQTEVIRRNEQELISISRQAGMAEVATSVLHNVGNVLNSVNVSLHVATDAVRKSKISGVSKLAAMLEQNSGRLHDFLANDPRGQNMPGYVTKLAEVLGREQALVLDELSSLSANIEHINDIVAMQQTYAKAGGVTETVNLAHLVEDALRMNASALERHNIRVRREFDKANAPEIALERNKALQILLNLISNAKHACNASPKHDKQLTLTLSTGNGSAFISCTDNGVGIPPENLNRIFNHGFTTRKNGHGFGLHSSALAAREMGGALLVQSNGPGHGATFTLEIPISARQA